MNSHVPFARFDAVLEDLGFQKQVIKGSRVNYRHASLDKPVKIKLHKPKDFVPNYFLAATPIQLDGLGIIPATEFDVTLEAAAE